MIVVQGAGAVGLALAARLARAGRDALLLVRRSDVAARIAREGVQVELANTRERFRVEVHVETDVARAARQLVGDPVLLCMRGPDVDAAASRLAAAAPDAVVATCQNDVQHGDRLLGRFAGVLGVVVRQTFTRTAPNTVLTLAPGRLVLGDHPGGAGPETLALADAFRTAGFDVGVSQRIVEDKWLKLAINLMSAPNALVRRPDHTQAAFVRTKVRLLEEARAVFAAARTVARSCDGRDRSLEEEIDFQARSLERGTSARALPLYNQVWQALRHGGPLEADGYHRRILALAADHGLEAPTNARVLAVLERAHAEHLGPECIAAHELLPEG